MLRLLEGMFRGKVKVQRIRMDTQFYAVETRKWAANQGAILEKIVPYQHHQMEARRDTKVISLIVDSACTKSAVTNSSDLKKPARHEVGIEGASPNYPQQSSLGGYIDGCVLSKSGMHIHIQFPKNLHGLHCDDSAADLLSVRRCLRNGWCKAVLDEEGSYLIHHDSGQKIRLRLD